MGALSQPWMRRALSVLALAALCLGGAKAPPTTVGSATSADGVRIAYETAGEEAPALVFVHGWSCDRSYWAGQLEPFSRDFRVVAVDLAGHGGSGLERQDWTIEAFGADVAAVVEKLGLQRVVLVGHSMGGDVIAAAARLLPGRVAGLIWVDTYKRLGPGRTPEQVAELVAPFRADFAGTTRTFVRGLFSDGADPALVERVAADMSSAPPAVALPAMVSSFNYSREMPRTLQELKLPTIALNPDDAPTDTASLARYGVTVTLMPGVGHFAQLEDPARFNQYLRKAIDEVLRSH